MAGWSGCWRNGASRLPATTCTTRVVVSHPRPFHWSSRRSGTGPEQIRMQQPRFMNLRHGPVVRALSSSAAGWGQAGVRHRDLLIRLDAMARDRTGGSRHRADSTNAPAGAWEAARHPGLPPKGGHGSLRREKRNVAGRRCPPASARTGPGSRPNTARQPRQPQGADGRSLRRRRGRDRQVTFGTPSRKRRRRFPQPAPQTATPPSAARGSHRIHGFGHTPPPAPRDRTRMTASTPLLVTFAAYLLLMVGLGFVAWRRTRTFDDYILGGRSLGSYVTALAAGASD